MFIKFTKGFILDCVAIAAMLSFVLAIALVNFGAFPIEETVTETHLAATAIYIVFWALYIYLAHLFRRRRILLFARIFSAFTLAFTLWFVVTATVTHQAVNGATASLFSVFTLALNNHYIGLYYFISPGAEELYALVSFLFVLLNFALSWGFWLADEGYFEALYEKLRRPSRKERLRSDILELRKEKEDKKP